MNHFIKSLTILILLLLMLASCDTADYESNEDAEDTAETVADTNPYHIHATAFEYTHSDDLPAAYPGSTAATMARLQYLDGWIYLHAGQMIYRLNPETGNVTALCADPICMHENEDCPFFGRFGVECDIHDNKITFLRMRREIINGQYNSITERVQYDIATKQLKVMEVIPDGLRAAVRYYYGDYRYYLKTLTDEDNNMTFELRRENLSSGEDIFLKDTGAVPVGILYVNDERIYLNEGVVQYYCELDNLEDQTVIYNRSTRDGACDGEHYYAVTRDESYTGKDGEGITTLVRYDMEGENLTTISDMNVGYVYLTEEYIYFRTKDRVSVGKRASGEDIMVDCSDIYRIPKSGGEAELVYTLPDDMKHYVISEFIVVGNYLYAPYGCYVPETKSLYESITATPYDVMRINLTTGDIYYISEN